jgi:hypothetical protein
MRPVVLKYFVGLGTLVSAVAMAQPPQTVPATLLTIAERPPLEFVALLANASIPAGIEVKASDDVYPMRPASYNRNEPKQVPISDLVTAFNTHHSDYTATLMADAIVVRPVDGRASFLDHPSTIDPPVTIVGVMDAERAIFAPLDARLLGPAIGGGLGREAARGLSTSFTLDGTGGRRVIDTLNQLARQMLGAWQVTTEERGRDWHVAKFGFIYTTFGRTVQSMRRD